MQTNDGTTHNNLPDIFESVFKSAPPLSNVILARAAIAQINIAISRGMEEYPGIVYHQRYYMHVVREWLYNHKEPTFNRSSSIATQQTVIYNMQQVLQTSSPTQYERLKAQQKLEYAKIILAWLNVYDDIPIQTYKAASAVTTPRVNFADFLGIPPTVHRKVNNKRVKKQPTIRANVT